MLTTSVFKRVGLIFKSNSIQKIVSNNEPASVLSSRIRAIPFSDNSSNNENIEQWKKHIVNDKLLTSPYSAASHIPEISFTEFMFTKMEKHRNNTMLINGITGAKLSYHNMLNFACKTASALLKRGLKTGDKVAIYSFNEPDYFVAFMGVLAAGGISVDINPNYIERELKTQIDNTGCVFIIAHPDCAATARKVAAQTPAIKDVIVFGKAEGCIPFSEFLTDDGFAFKGLQPMGDPRKVIAQMMSSSGTTGFPKSVCKSHYSLTAMALCLDHEDLVISKPGDVGLLVLPLYHIFPLLVILTGSIPGTSNVLIPKFVPENYLSAIQNYKVTSMPIVPPLVLFLLQHPLVSKYDLSSLKSIVCGAAPIATDLLLKLKEKFDLSNVKQGYGMTEITPIAIGVNFNGGSVPSNVGRPVKNTEIKILDLNTGEQLGPNQPGELLAKSACGFNEYLNNPKATAETLDEEGWVHTGDIGSYDENGFVYVVDRLKDLIKYKGHQVAPAELEELLLAHPGVKDVAVIGIPDDRAGEKARAYVVLEPCVINQLSEKQLCQFIADKTSHDKHLHGGVQFVEMIPKSAAGKILKKELRAKL